MSGGPLMQRLGLTIAIIWFALVQAATMATAGCSASDILESAKDGIVDGATFLKNNSECAPYFGNPGFWIISGGVTTATMASKDMNGWCKEFQKKYDDFKDDQKKITEWFDLLPDDNPVRKALKQVFGDLSENSGELIAAASWLNCSCAIATESGVNKVVGQLGECGKSLLCGGQELLDDLLDQHDGPSCSGSQQPPPTLIDCANPHPHEKDPKPDQYGNYNNYMENVFFGGVQSKGDFYYDSNHFCYCPAPMKFVWHSDDTTVYNNDEYASCDCPAGTHKAALDDPSESKSPALYRICLCNKTNLPMNADGTCPPPPPKCDCQCPNNQVPVTEITADNQCKCGCKCGAGQSLVAEKCVTPCVGASVRLANGSCCHPSRVSSCGMCCIGATKPDAKTGSCSVISVGLPKTPNALPNQSFPNAKP